MLFHNVFKTLGSGRVLIYATGILGLLKLITPLAIIKWYVMCIISGSVNKKLLVWAYNGFNTNIV